MKIKKVIKKILQKEIKLNIVYNSDKEYLKNKNIIVTGGTSGIGYDIAKRAVNLGANVLVIGRSVEKLENVKKELKCHILQWDITDINKAKDNILYIKSLFNGEIDCIINNAGMYDNSSCIETSEELFDEMISTNLKACYFISQELIKQCFLPQHRGNIIFISSNRGIIGDDCVYGISKAGVIAFTKGLAKKYLNDNIRVNSIAPGMTTSNINNIKDSDNLYFEGLKGKRVLSSREIAEVAMFLISDSSSCITGQIIACDNGESIL